MLGHGQAEPEQMEDGANHPLGLAQRQTEHKRNTTRSIRAVVIANSEECGSPPGVVRGAAFQPITSSVTQTVRLPRWRRAASYSLQLRIRRLGRAM